MGILLRCKQKPLKMKKELTINKATLFSLKSLIVSPVADIYSKIMGVKFNTADTLRILQVQTALLMLLLPVHFNPMYHIAMLLWFAVSLYQCKYLNNKFTNDDD